MTAFATESREEIEKKIDVDVEGYQQLADSLEEAGLTGVGDLGDTGVGTTVPEGGPGTFTPGSLPAAEGDQVDTGSIFYPPEVDTTPLSQPEGDDPTADPTTVTSEDDAPVIKTAEEELADLGLTDGAPPVRPTETLFGSLYSEAADNSLTFKGTDPEEFIKKLAKDES